MRPTLVLLLLLALLALGGTLFVLIGRPEAAPAVDAPLSSGNDASKPSQAKETALLTPASNTDRDKLAAAERTSITAPAAAPAPGAKVAQLATLVGRVVDTAGQAISGAEIRARLGDFDLPDLDDPHGAKKPADKLSTTSDAQGRFEISGVKPGSVRLSVRAAGYVPLDKSGVGVPAADRHDLGDLALETSVILEGRVVDSHGGPVAAARLARANPDGVMYFTLGDDSTQGPPPLAITAADGTFRIDQLASGPWRLRIASETHPDKTESGLTKRPGERVAGLSFVLEDGFEIAGRVTGIPPASQGDASVVAVPNNAQGELIVVGMEEGPLGENRRRSVPASDGSFVVKGLRQGAYQLQARIKGGADSFWPRSASERVDAKSGDRGVLIAWQPASVLSFQVVDAQTKTPIEEMRVSAVTRNSMVFMDPRQRDPQHYENGQVRIDDLRPRDDNDRATLDVDATGYQSLHTADIALNRGAQLELGVLELKRATTVNVRVIDSVTRGGIAKAKVSLKEVGEDSGFAGAIRMSATISSDSDSSDVSFDNGDSTSALTDADGFARLNSKPGKRGKVSVTMDGYAPATTEVFEMPADANVDLSVALDQGGSVEITLLAADGTPVSGARIDHRAPDASRNPFDELGGPFGRGKGAATDAQGKVTFANLAPGTHRFRPAGSSGSDMSEGLVMVIDGAEDGGGGWSDVEIVRSKTAALVLREPERAAIKGRVHEGGNVLAGASITLKKGHGDSRFEAMDDLPFGGGGPRTKSDGEGRYHFEGVDAGSYELIVRHATRSMPARFPIEVENGVLEYDIDLPISILEGRVATPEGKPIAGAKVWAKHKPADGVMREERVFSIMAGSGDGGGMLLDSANGLDQSRARTDEQGRFSLRGVENDVDLIVCAEAADCEPGKSDPVHVALGQTKSGVNVELAAAGLIKVKVIGAAGKNAAPCMVHADYADPMPEGKTIQPKTEFAQGGSVTLKGLRPGRWTLYAEPLGNFGGNESSPQGEKKEVVVVAHETAQVELPTP